MTGSTGNFGIQAIALQLLIRRCEDQRLALRWVRENLEAMGGDPNRVRELGKLGVLDAEVMIFGQSAGAGAASWAKNIFLLGRFG